MFARSAGRLPSQVSINAIVVRKCQLLRFWVYPSALYAASTGSAILSVCEAKPRLSSSAYANRGYRASHGLTFRMGEANDSYK